ncbi:MAG: hypothetical protein JNL67_03830 [Planctomycetaceae bacterium]|nr:hypothetical protein [Planctomycetaceae bacterium]
MNTDLRPTGLAELEEMFGAASDAGFGSAVFFSSGDRAAERSLEAEGLQVYEKFCGKKWTKFGVENWLSNWKLLHERPIQDGGDIVAEIEAIRDPESGSAAQMLLDAGPDVERAATTLRTVFNDPDIARLQIFKIGDGGAMSGAIIAAQWPVGVRVFLIILLD